MHVAVNYMDEAETDTEGVDGLGNGNGTPFCSQIGNQGSVVN